MKRLFFIISLFLIVFPVLGKMTIDDCLRYAALHAHDNKMQALEVEKAGADKGIVAAGLMPYLGLSSSGNISFGRNIDPETNTYDNRQTLSTGFGLSMSLPLFDGLVRINNLKAAEIARRRKMSETDIERDRISFEVIRAFYKVSYCRAMVEQMKTQFTRDSIDLEATRKAESLGVKSGADVAQMMAVLAADEFELTNQQGLLEKAHLALKGSMGMPFECDLPELDLESTLGADCTGIVNPRISEARLALKQSQYGLRAARGAFSPKLSLSGGVSTSYYRLFGTQSVATEGFRRQWRDNMGEYIGISLSLPLFTGLENVNRLKRAKIEVAENRVRLEKIEYEIAREMQETELDVATAEMEYNAAVKRLEAEEIAYSTVRQRYELGSASAIDLNTAGVQLATARALLEGKRIEMIIGEITLYYYKGGKLIND